MGPVATVGDKNKGTLVSLAGLPVGVRLPFQNRRRDAGGYALVATIEATADGENTAPRSLT